MGLIQKLLGRTNEDKQKFKEEFKQAEREMKINRLIEERQKSSNRRELEKYYKDKEEERVKIELDKIHKQQNKESWKPKHQILDKGTSILKDDRPILKEKNIFMDNKNKVPLQNKREGMFFRW